MDYLELLLDALLDCAKLIPFLLVTIFLMEYIEHRAAGKFVCAMQRAGRFGPALGATLGLVPQCGFSAACAHLFNGGLVSAGTLVAVFLSTSDEAIPILLANPTGFSAVWKLMATKLVVAIIAGFTLDFCWSLKNQQAAYAKTETPHECESDDKFIHIFVAAIKRTLSILLFIFLVTLALNILIAGIGEEQFSALLLPGPLQPLLAGLIGFIPNCAASVLITQLYLDGMITFGSTVAGLCTASGIGLLVLMRGKRGIKTYLLVLGVVYAAAVVSGLLLQLIA
ncbi:MAG: putative manganese transporter [Clostridia bacterium]